MTPRDQLILILLMAMAMALTLELLYIVKRKKRRKEEMSLLKKSGAPVETMAEKAHNSITTSESISQSLSRQGVNTTEADSLISQAKRSLSSRDYTSAIEQADAAKLVLLRLRRESEAKAGARAQPPSPDPEKRPMDRSIYEREAPAREEKSLDSLPTNYVQSKFMLATTKDLLEKRKIDSGEAYDFYTGAVAAYQREDYTKALSLAIKAEKLLDSGTLTLIGEEKPREDSEVIEIMVCPGCESEISDDDLFCRECGQNLSSAKDCPGCGMEAGPSDKFCRKCGTKMR